MPWEQRSRRRAELPSNWTSTIAPAILKRDAHTCRINDPGCTTTATEVDHIGNRHNHQPTNLRAACHHCHSRRTTTQGHNAARAARAKAKHPVEQHPALTRRR